MPNSPLRLIARVALVAGFAAPAGCETFRSADPPPAATGVSAEPTLTRGVAPVAQTGPATPPGRHATRLGHYVFYHDFPLDRADPLFVELQHLPDQLGAELGVPPPTGIIQVFLFDTQDVYERYMNSRYRHLPTRRAYFIAEPQLGGGADELKVFTWMGDHLRTDLRHELTHALLHSVLEDVPLWLDEGLAGFFELPPEQDGVNAQHVELLRRGPFQPDLARLESLDQVAQMEKPEYREAWAWVHLMLRGHPAARQVLRDYLRELRTTGDPGPLGPRLARVVPDLHAALAAHLGGVRLTPAGNRQWIVGGLD